MALPSYKHLFTFAEFLDLEERSEVKHEYIAGEIFAMAGGTATHGAIAYNLAGVTSAQLPDGCRGLSSDVMIYIKADNTSVYPDLSIVCGEVQYQDAKKRVIMNPRVIFEVLSETTEKDDRGWKRVAYQKIESLTDYLIISQDQAFAEHYRRDADGVWQHGCIEGLDRNIVIESINCVLPMAKVYRDIPFE